MKKKWGLLFVAFIAFYTLVHGIRQLPELMHGHLDWNGETTYLLSVIRIAADIAISFLFTLFPYLLCCRYYPQRKFKHLVIGLVISISACFLIGYWWTVFMEQAAVRLSNYLPQAVFFYGMNAVFGMAFYFVRYAQYKEVQEKEAQLQNKQSELSFLRSQINPHFLFNNLNNIYSLVYYQSDQALNAISGLSELLRYMLYDTSETVTLAKEVTYIEKYIALQQLRFEKPSEIEFKVSGNFDDFNIPPLLLIPFVENAFKHGDASAGKWLDISLASGLDLVRFSCSNKKAAKQQDPTGGIGIDNVKRRLALLFPGKHHLDIEDGTELFTVKLELYYGK
jgi:two-component system LytT family sensor kinase